MCMLITEGEEGGGEEDEGGGANRSVKENDTKEAQVLPSSKQAAT